MKRNWKRAWGKFREYSKQDAVCIILLKPACPTAWRHCEIRLFFVVRLLFFWRFLKKPLLIGRLMGSRVSTDLQIRIGSCCPLSLLVLCPCSTDPQFSSSQPPAREKFPGKNISSGGRSLQERQLRSDSLADGE